jgi:hypothetical protein
LKTKVIVRLGEFGHQKLVQRKVAAGWAYGTPGAGFHTPNPSVDAGHTKKNGTLGAASGTPEGSVWDAGSAFLCHFLIKLNSKEAMNLVAI